MAKIVRLGRFYLGGRVQPQSLAPIDYAAVLLRLTAHACRFLGFCQSSKNERLIQGTGKSPEDFAIHVLEGHGSCEICYDGSKGMPGLIRVLTVAMERDILDALDRSEHKLANFLDPSSQPAADEGGQNDETLANLAEEPDDIPEWLDGESFKHRIYALVRGDPELTEMAEAIFEVNALMPREIAEVCLTTTDDIQNRKRKFDRLLRKHGYYAKGAQDEG